MKTKIIPMKKFLFAILMVNACMYCQAQKKIGIGGNGVQVSVNPVCYGDSLTYSLWVKNKGNQPIVADTFFLRGIFVTAGQGPKAIEMKTLPQFTLNVGDSVFLTFSDSVTNPDYLASTNNIIVIWPAIIGAQTIDSNTIQLQVDSCVMNGIERGEENSLHIYFDNSSSQLFFFSETEISSAEIFDVNGRLVHRCSPATIIEQLPKFTSGIYFVQTQFINGRRNVFRFVRRE